MDDDREANLRLLLAEHHGQLHARLFELAGARRPDGKFAELDVPREIARAVRIGPVISARAVDVESWLPRAQVLAG